VKQLTATQERDLREKFYRLYAIITFLSNTGYFSKDAPARDPDLSPEQTELTEEQAQLAKDRFDAFKKSGSSEVVFRFLKLKASFKRKDLHKTPFSLEFIRYDDNRVFDRVMTLFEQMSEFLLVKTSEKELVVMDKKTAVHA
jgi:hypothetical protein